MPAWICVTCGVRRYGRRWTRVVVAGGSEAIRRSAGPYLARLAAPATTSDMTEES